MNNLKKQISEKGFLQIGMTGHSMSPVIYDQEIYTVKAPGNRKPQKFDLVLFSSGETLICHYIRKVINDHKIYTQGINNRVLDKPISKDEIIGYVTKKLPLKYKMLYSLVDLILNLTALRRK